MPTIYELELSAKQGRARVPTPFQMHGMVCSLLEESDAEHRAQSKGWSLRPPEATGNGWRVSVTWHADHALPDLRGSGSGLLRLGSVHYRIESVTSREVPLRYLLLEGADRADMDFLTPTWFSRNGQEYPLPDPRRVYLGLSQRWGAMDSEDQLLSAEVRDEVVSLVRITRFQGETRQFQLGKSRRTGFVGLARYGLPRTADPRVREAFAAMSRLAQIVGVGAMTTHGAGCVEVETSNRG